MRQRRALGESASTSILVTGMGVAWHDVETPADLWAYLLNPPVPTPVIVPTAEAEALFTVKERRRSTPAARLAMLAGLRAFRDSGEPPIEDRRGSVAAGAGFDATDFDAFIRAIDRYRESGHRSTSPMMAVTTMPNIGAALLAARVGWNGGCWSVAAGCASSTVAICQACDHLATGQAEAVLVGGTSNMTSELWDPRSVLSNLRVHSEATVSTPFGTGQSGFVHSEGGAFLVLESEGHVRARNGSAYAAIQGWGSATDVDDLVAPSEGGPAMQACYQSALARAGIPASAVGYVNPHGSGTAANDATEEAALTAVFAGSVPPVSPTKAATGHLSSGAGAIEAVGTVLAIAHGMIPPTAHTRTLRDGCSLPVVIGQPRAWQPGYAITSNLGLGGHNAALVLGPPPEDLRRPPDDI